jgi:hypothetical protein
VNWESMTPRERDMEIARKFFGWKWLTSLGFVWFGPSESKGATGYGTAREADELDLTDGMVEPAWWLADEAESEDCPVVPHYTGKDVWEVIEVVRNWDCDQQKDFHKALQDAMVARLGCEFVWSHEVVIYMTPDDICRAALECADSAGE